MAPLLLRAAGAACLALGVGDLAWLDANVARLDGATPPALLPIAPPAPPPPPFAPVTLASARVPRAPAPPPSCVLHYGSGDATLADGHVAALATIAEALARDPDAVATIDGHADPRGAPEANEALSERRAASVAQWLAQHGVDERRLRARGFGATRPIDPGDGDDALARDRRVEIHLEPREP